MLGIGWAVSIFTTIAYGTICFIIGGIWFLKAFLDYTRGQKGIMMGVGFQQNPMSSTIVASLHADVVAVDDFLDVNRFNNIVHDKKRLYKLVIKRSLSETFVIGLLLCIIGVLLLKGFENETSPMDSVVYKDGYSVKNYPWGISEEEVLNNKALEDGSIMMYQEVTFDQLNQFDDNRLTGVSFVAKVNQSEAFVNILMAFEKVLEKDFNAPKNGEMSIFDNLPKIKSGPKSVTWLGDDGSRLIVIIENTAVMKMNSEYKVAIVVEAPEERQ
jgi:hypothetical protein